MKALNNLQNIKTIVNDKWHLKTFDDLFDIIAKYVDLSDHIIPETQFVSQKSNETLKPQNTVFTFNHFCQLSCLSFFCFLLYFFGEEGAYIYRSGNQKTIKQNKGKELIGIHFVNSIVPV